MGKNIQIILIFLFIVLGNSIDTGLQAFEIKNSCNITIHVGKTYYLKFRANPSTGYDWYLQNRNQIDSTKIQLVNMDSNSQKVFVSDANLENCKGVGGYDYYQIKGINKGTLDLLFFYKRYWEQEIKTKVTVTLNIEVDYIVEE